MDKSDSLFQVQLDRRIERELQGQIDRRFSDINKEITILRQEIKELRLTIKGNRQKND